MNPAFLAPAFGLGMLATMAPCVLPLYPGFIAYLASTGDRLRGRAGARFLGLFVLAGVLVMMLALAATIAALRVAAGQVLAFVTPVADLVVIGLGVLLFAGLNPFSRLPQIASMDTTRGPYINAFAYGLLYGPIALPCSGPLVLSIFTLSLGMPGFFQQLLFFLIFGLGFGLPLVILPFLVKARQDWLLSLISRNYSQISRVGGVILVTVGIWDLWVNFPFLQLYLAL